MNHLRATEKKLVQSFLLSAILFLLIFEGIFLGSRYFLEKKYRENIFIEETDFLIGDRSHRDYDTIYRPLHIGLISTDSFGNILESYYSDFQKNTHIYQIFSEQTLRILSEKVTYIENIMIRKMERDGEIYYFISEAHSLKTLFHGILIFLVLNITLLIPIWYLVRNYVRKILTPVKENIDTMSHFVHDAGHELKTPIAIISGNLQIMRENTRVDYELIEESLETIHTMNESIQGLLELSDINTPNTKNLAPLADLINQEIKNIKNPQNIKISHNISPKIHISASNQHLSILLRNLIENAIKYNKPHGKVTLSFEKNTLIIEDTGIGMESENLQRIFDRFYRINKHNGVIGSGIGLTLVDKIVKLYNWKIALESEIDKGTKISITF